MNTMIENEEQELAARFDDKIAAASSEILAQQRALDRAGAAMDERWGRLESDRRRMGHRPQYEAALREFDAHIRPLRARISALRGELEYLPGEKADRLAVLRQTRPYAPALIFPNVDVLPSAETDDALQTLRTKRDAASATRLEHDDLVAKLLPFIERERLLAEDMAQRHALKLAGVDELRAAHDRFARAQDALQREREAIAAADGDIAGLDQQISDRDIEIRARRQTAVDRALPVAARAAADAVVDAIRAMSRLHRLRNASDTSAPYWIITALVGDRCEGREFLERVQADGWTPKK